MDDARFMRLGERVGHLDAIVQRQIVAQSSGDGHDQVGVRRNLLSRDEPGVGLNNNLDSGGLGGAHQSILCVMHDDPGDIDSVLPQHVQGRHAEMAGADKGDPHGCFRP